MQSEEIRRLKSIIIRQQEHMDVWEAVAKRAEMYISAADELEELREQLRMYKESLRDTKTALYAKSGRVLELEEENDML